MVLVLISAQGPEKLVLINATSQGPWDPCASSPALYELASLVYIPCCCQRQEGGGCVPSVGKGDLGIHVKL